VTLSDRAPAVTAESLPFWEACDREELILQRCTRCRDINWFPRSFCRTCSSPELEWEPSSGKGTVETFSLIYRPMNASYRDEVPYVLALVHLDDGPTFLTRIVGETALDTQIDDHVGVRFAVTTGHRLPVFERET
jgi:uncharacterized protein